MFRLPTPGQWLTGAETPKTTVCFHSQRFLKFC